MKTLLIAVITLLISINANALEFIGSDKHRACAEKVAVELGIQDADWRVYMEDAVLSRKVHAYVSDTNVKKTIALVVNRKLDPRYHSSNISIAHEMVHVMQKIRGDVFDMSGSYKKRAHEIEAYNLEKTLAKVCR